VTVNTTNLPKTWLLPRLGDITRRTRPRRNPRDYPGLRFIGMENVEAHSMRLLGTVPAESMQSTAIHFQPGDVLYGRLRPYLNKVFRPDFEGLCSAEFIVFVEHDSLNSKYLQYLLNSVEFVAFASRLNAGDRPRVDFEQISDYGTPLAPRAEQERIVAEIEKQLTRLDAAVAGLDRVRTNLNRHRAAVLKVACEGQLVPTEAELARREGRPYESASVMLERALAARRSIWKATRLSEYVAANKKPPKNWEANYEVSPSQNGSVLPILSPGWCWTTLSNLTPAARGSIKTGPFGSLLKKHEHLSAGVPVLGIENIDRMRFVHGSKIHISNEKAAELAGYDARPGDILISRSGTVGEVCVVPNAIGEARISTNLMRIRLSQNVMLPEFLCLLFNGSPHVLKQVSALCSGSTRDFLNHDILMALVFPLPPLSEQKRIVSEVERRTSIIQGTDVEIQANLARSEKLRQAILKKAFEGKLVAQDPDDEPATALLARFVNDSLGRSDSKLHARETLTTKNHNARRMRNAGTLFREKR
jgi:type I restriction enzyme S subunit